MKTKAALPLLLALPLALSAQPEPDARAAAEAALRGGVPQAAIAPLKESIRKGRGNRPELSRLLARLQLAAGSPDEALATLDASGDQGNTEWKVLRAAALAAQGGKDAATKLLVPLAAQSPEASLLLARIFAEQGDSSRARGILTQVAAKTEKDPHRARLLLDLALSGQDQSQSEALLREYAESGILPEAELKAAEGRMLLGRKKAGEAAGNDPSGDLRSWSAKKDEPRGVESTLQLARLDLDTKGTEAALASLQELLALREIDAGARERAVLMAAEAKIAAGQAAEALAQLGSEEREAGYDTLMLRGRAHAASGSQRDAHDAFVAAARTSRTPAEKSAAEANAFITALAAEDLPLARGARDRLREAAPDDPRLLEWSFLLAAAEAGEGRIDDLSVLARRAPSTDYAFQAKLALAEWRLARGEAEAARRILKTAEPEAVEPQRAAALEAAGIFAADNDGSKARGELVTACEKFLADYPDSSESTDIAFKLAELHSRGGDHAAAETILARLMDTLPDGESAAMAKFLAAQAAARSMSETAAARALVWFNELAQDRSALRHRARFEQASLLLRQRKFADALALQDSILAADPPPEVKYAARMERGDILFAIGATEPAKLEQAAAAYAELAADDSVPADWRDQAACKRAAALARRGQTEKALALYREIIDRPPSAGADQFWFMKAGFEAARLLEEQKDWPAAVAVYDRMASASGAQREELEQRARKLRLEHFIWEN